MLCPKLHPVLYALHLLCTMYSTVQYVKLKMQFWMLCNALESDRHSVRKTVTVRIGLKTLLVLFILQNGIKCISMQIGTHL